MKLCNSVHLLLVTHRANCVVCWRERERNSSHTRLLNLVGESSWFDRKTLKRQLGARDMDIRILEGITMLIIMGTIPHMRNWQNRQNIPIS